MARSPPWRGNEETDTPRSDAADEINSPPITPDQFYAMQNLYNTPTNIMLDWPPPSELKHPLLKSAEGRVHAERLGGRAEVSTNEAGRPTTILDRPSSSAAVQIGGLSISPLREKIREGGKTVAELYEITLAEMEELKKLKAAEDRARALHNQATPDLLDPQDQSGEGFFGGSDFADMKHILEKMDEESDFPRETEVMQQPPKTPRHGDSVHKPPVFGTKDGGSGTATDFISETLLQEGKAEGRRTPVSHTRPTTQKKPTKIPRLSASAKKVLDMGTPTPGKLEHSKRGDKIEPPPSPCGGIRYCEKNHRHQLRISGPVSTPPWISENRMTPSTEFPGDSPFPCHNLDEVTPTRVVDGPFDSYAPNLLTPRRHLSLRAVTPSPAPLTGQRTLRGRPPTTLLAQRFPVSQSHGEDPFVDDIQHHIPVDTSEQEAKSPVAAAPLPQKQAPTVKKQTAFTSRLLAPTAASRARSAPRIPESHKPAKTTTLRPALCNPARKEPPKSTVAARTPGRSFEPAAKQQKETKKSVPAVSKAEAKKPAIIIPKIIKTPAPKPSFGTNTPGLRQRSPSKGRTPHKPHYLAINTQRTSVFDRLSAPTAASRARSRNGPEAPAVSNTSRAASRADHVRPKSSARLAAPTAASLAHKTPFRSTSARSRTPPLYAPIPLSPKNQTEDWEQRGYAAYEAVRLLAKYCHEDEPRIMRHEINKVFIEMRREVAEVRGDVFVKKRERVQAGFGHVQRMLWDMMLLVKGKEEGEVVDGLVKRVGTARF